MISAVENEIAKQVTLLSRGDVRREVLDHIFCFGEGQTAIANEFAPEHVSIVTRHSEKMSEGILNAGSIQN